MDVPLSALTPGATYHFRFVAKSSGGGPVRGAGGTEAIDGEEGSFTTYTAPMITRNCGNEFLRAQANLNPATGQSFSRDLASCRAYEMVSPVEKNGGDITDGEVANAYTSPRKSSRSGERIHPLLRCDRSTIRRARRSSTSILSKPRRLGLGNAADLPAALSAFLWPPTPGQFKAFDEDVCEGWFLQDNELTLAEGAPAEVASIYKRNYCERAGYELLTPVDPPGFGPAPEINKEWYVPNFQGSSADGSHSVFSGRRRN